MTRLERIEKYAVIAASVAAIAGVVFAGWQLSELVKQNQHEGPIKSAELMLQLDDRIEDHFSDIESDINNNEHNHPLVNKNGGLFPKSKVEGYIDQLDDVGLLLKDKLILPDMAYNDFSYDAEKAWCNVDVRKIISDERGASVEKVAGKDGDFHLNFERLAKGFLSIDKFTTCANVDKT